jgi:hypothetical protein
MSEELYFELLRRAGSVKKLSQTIEELLRKSLAVESPDKMVELPKDQTIKGSNDKMIPPVERKVEAQSPTVPPVEGNPTPRQVTLVESLLRQLGDDWSSVREVLLLDRGIEAPEDWRQLSGETLDRVVKVLKEWAARPPPSEVKAVKARAQMLAAQGVEANLPESAREVLNYHLVKLALLESGVLKPNKK